MYLPVIADGDGPAMNSLFLNFDSTQIQRLQLIQNSLAWSITRMPRMHYLTPILKSLHRLKIPECIHFKVLSLTYNSGTPGSTPSPLTFVNFSQFSQSALPDHPSVSPFLDPLSLPISRSSREPYASLHRIFGMTYHPSELRTFSLPPPSSSQITKHHLHPAEPAPLFVMPRTFHSKLKFHLKNSYPDSPYPLTPSPPPKLRPL